MKIKELLFITITIILGIGALWSASINGPYSGGLGMAFVMMSIVAMILLSFDGESEKI